MKIGFIGVGNMGAPICRNLIREGHPVRVHDISPAAVERMTALGAEAAQSPRHLAEAAEVIFACLPTPDPKAAADELERCVTKLDFKGAMVHGLTNGVFFDDKRFWPIFERAQALDVPLYMHPAVPHPAVVEAYYKDYLDEFPGLLTAAWGFTVETATQGIRLVLSGVFDAYPDVKIILGHLGESLPFSLWRIDQALSRQGNRNTSFSFRDYFSKHFWITTSGNFSNPALLCCVMEMGVDRILFSVDYPFVLNQLAADWIPTIPLSAEDRAKILSGNADRLLRL